MFYFLSFFFFSSRRRHTRCSRDWSSDVCSSDLSNDVSRVPPEWYAWLTRQIDDVPDKALPPPPKFLKPPAPNLTGTPQARSEERRVGKECRSRGSPYQ